MHKNTLSLLNKIQQYEEAETRIKCLKNSYVNETAYIVAGGPSLNNYTHEYLQNFLSDKLTFSIKQSWNILKEQTDFHLLNFCNFAPYNWDNCKSIITWAIFEEFHPKMIFDNNLEYDLMIPIYRNSSFRGGMDGPDKMTQSVAELLDFENILLDNPENGINQPWGPGIMYEMAIPLAIYLGCKKIVTIGWDIGDISSFSNGIEDETQRVFQEHFYGDEHNKIVYAKTSMGPREIMSVAKSTKEMYYWLKNKGIEWEMVSDRNPGYEGIKRIRL
jgi:hypothetical protein